MTGFFQVDARQTSMRLSGFGGEGRSVALSGILRDRPDGSYDVDREFADRLYNKPASLCFYELNELSKADVFDGFSFGLTDTAASRFKDGVLRDCGGFLRIEPKEGVANGFYLLEPQKFRWLIDMIEFAETDTRGRLVAKGTWHREFSTEDLDKSGHKHPAAVAAVSGISLVHTVKSESAQ